MGVVARVQDEDEDEDDVHDHDRDRDRDRDRVRLPPCTPRGEPMASPSPSSEE